MGRLFGTDGIRGVANVDLRPALATALGRAVASRIVGDGGVLVVGQDTRRSGDMFVAAITAGATSLGADVHRVGIVPTPGLAFLTGDGPFAAGIMVSASHNPAEDNGLKVLDADGLKLDDAIEEELEAAHPACRRAAGGPARPDRPRDRCDRAAGALRRPSARAGRPHRRDRAPDHRSTPPMAPASAVAARNPGARPGRRGRHPRGPGWRQHQPGLRGDAPGGPRRDRVERAAPTSGSRSTAMPTGCVAVDATGEVVDGDRLIGMLAVERLGSRRPPRRRARRLRAVERRPQRGGRVRRRARRPDAGRRQVHPRRHAGLGRGPGWREERPRHRARAFLVRRRPRHRARGAARDDRPPARPLATLPRRSRSCRSSSVPCGSGTRTNGRATAPPARHRRCRVAAGGAAASSSGPRARSPPARHGRGRGRTACRRTGRHPRDARGAAATLGRPRGPMRERRGGIRRPSQRVRHRRLYRPA